MEEKCTVENKWDGIESELNVQTVMTIEEHTIVAECYQLRTNFIYDMRESLTQIENIFLQHRIYCTEEYVSIRIKLLELLVDYTYKSASKI